MAHRDSTLYSVAPDGTKEDAWIFEELLGDDPLDDDYTHVVGDALHLYGTETSGNYGHVGRPGEVGGSGPGGTKSDAFKQWFGKSKVVDEHGEPLRLYHATGANFDTFATTDAPKRWMNTPEMGAHFGTKTQVESFDDSVGRQVLPVYLAIENPVRVKDFGDFNAVSISRQLVEQGVISAKEAKALEAIREDGLPSYGKQNKYLQDLLESKGHDGIVYHNRREGYGESADTWAAAMYSHNISDEDWKKEHGGEDSYIVFKPTQVKSAIGNKGTYDKTNPSIAASERFHLYGTETSGNHGHVGRPGEVGGSAPGRATDTPAFKKWFGESKVVDDNGRPLRVYHGTTASVDFDEFNKTQDLGYHFGTQEQANYRSDWNKGGRVLPVYLSLQNPIRMPDHVWDTADTATKWAIEQGLDKDGSIQRVHKEYAAVVEKAVEAVGHAYYHGTIEEHGKLDKAVREIKREHKTAVYRLLKAAIEAKGYDGIVYKNEVEGEGDSYIAFKPSQIKSAIGNRGTYDPVSPKIAASRFLLYGTEKSGNYGHAGRPGQVGGSAAGDGAVAQTVSKVSTHVEEMQRRQLDKVEHHIGIDVETGDLLFEVVGDAGGSEGAMARGLDSPSLDDLRPSGGVTPLGKVGDKQIIDIHTHPPGHGAKNGAFSDGDFGQLVWSHVDTMIVVDDESIGVLKKTPAFYEHQKKAWAGDGTPWTPRRVRDRYNEILDELTTPDKDWTPDQALLDTNAQLAKEIGVVFGVVPKIKPKKELGFDVPYRARLLDYAMDLGGEHSGNFGHAGRPGEVGGSAPGGSDTIGKESVVKSDGGKIAFEETKRPVTEAIAQHVLGQSAESVAAGMLADVPGDLTVQWMASSVLDETTGLPSTVIMAADRKDGLSIVRRFTREPDGTLTVYHDLMEVPMHGRGTAKALLGKSFDTYRAMGVDTVKTSANLEVGGYAWAKFGFKAREPDDMAESMRQMLSPRTNGPEQRPGAGLMQKLPGREALLALIEQHKDDPRLPWHIAGAVTADGRQIGKELLLNTSWEAELRLDDKEAVTRLEHYVSTKKDLANWFDLGGEGSGNFGHAGRPGEVGGSASGKQVIVSPHHDRGVFIPADYFIGNVMRGLRPDPALEVKRIPNGDRFDVQVTTENKENADNVTKAGSNVGATVERTITGNTHVVLVKGLAPNPVPKETPKAVTEASAVTSAELKAETEKGGRFETREQQTQIKIATEERLAKLATGTGPKGYLPATILGGTPNLIRAGEQVATVLEEMKAQGMEMPHSILIRNTEGNVQAAIRGTRIQDAATSEVSFQKNLVVEIPLSLPNDVRLDDAVTAVFGKTILSTNTRIGRVNDVVGMTPNDEKYLAEHGDPKYPIYDRFTARTMRDIVIHEMGHVQAGHREELDVGPLLQRGTFPTVMSIRRAMVRVSAYAGQNSNEFLAESFTRLYRGETLDEDSQKLYDTLNGPKVPKR